MQPTMVSATNAVCMLCVWWSRLMISIILTLSQVRAALASKPCPILAVAPFLIIIVRITALCTFVYIEFRVES